MERDSVLKIQEEVRQVPKEISPSSTGHDPCRHARPKHSDFETEAFCSPTTQQQLTQKTSFTSVFANWGGSCGQFSCSVNFVMLSCAVRFKRPPTKVNGSINWCSGSPLVGKALSPRTREIGGQPSG